MTPDRSPRLAAVYFGTGGAGDQYGRLARVLAYTAAAHCPAWTITIERAVVPAYNSALGVTSHVTNSQKLEWWRGIVARAQDGDRILLMDADMAIFRPLDPVWDLPFDLAYTMRETGRLPLNGGVVFLRVSDRVRAFVDQWFATNQRFLGDPAAHRPWRMKYAGINQASFGYMLERTDHGCDLRRLTCREWNCENTTWALFDPTITRIVHLKSGLRRALFGAPIVRSDHKALIALWHGLEAKARRRAELDAARAARAFDPAGTITPGALPPG